MARIQDMAHYVNDYKLAVHTHVNSNDNYNNNGVKPKAFTMADGNPFKPPAAAVIDIERNYPTPVPQKNVRNYSNSDEDSADWNWSFCIVGLPFILLGFPIHLMLGDVVGVGVSIDDEDGHGNEKEPEITSIGAWLQSIFVPFKCLRILASMLLFVAGCGILSYFGYTVWNLVYNLVYLGELNAVVVASVEQLLHIVPVVIPLVFFWLRGYNVKNVLDSFNTIFASFAKAFHNTWKNRDQEKPGSGPGLRTRLPPTSFWCKLLRLYVAIIILHGLELFLTITTTDTFSGYDLYFLVTNTSWIEYAFEIMNSLVLPVYCLFCWVLHSELELLIGYLNLLVFYESRPNFTIFNEIKYLYKKIARQIMAVNKVFSLYLSWLFFIVWGFATYKAGEAGIMFFKYLTNSPAPPALIALVGSMIGGGDVMDDSQSESAGLSEEQRVATAEQAAVVMRETLCMALVALLQVALLGYTTAQAIHVNKAARSLHVILNDFSTYHMSNALTTELYQAFRLLKAFIHSTMERQEDPALLRIPILNYTPYFGHRLHSYHLRF